MSEQNESFERFIEEMSQKDDLGWDLSYIEGTGRISTDPLPWSYTSRILRELSTSTSLLDIATGSGEFLSLLGSLPKNTCATDSYLTNVNEAKKRLASLGVKVYPIYHETKLPFVNDSFHLIITRYRGYAPEEVYRVLAPSGKFITQQIGGISDIELNKRLNAPLSQSHSRWNLKIAVNQLEKIGFKITYQDEVFPHTRFYDVGAIVYYLKYIEWQIPKFTIQRYYEPLKKIHQEIIAKGYIEIKSHRFIVEATK